VTVLEVDRDACQGHGRCYALAPALFEPDEAGFASVKVVNVPAEQLDQALLAVNSCPELAIRLRPTS